LKSIDIAVAGFTIRIQSENVENIALEDGYIPFIKSKFSENQDVLIHSNAGIPSALLTPSKIIFEAKNESQLFFSISEYNDDYKFIIYNQQSQKDIQQVAILKRDLSVWTVYSANAVDPVYPLLYPLGALVLYYLTVKYDAIMIHASGVFDGLKGRIFTGFSGVGKSTMAGLWMNKGNLIINDDRLIIRKENDAYFMHNTPMFYSDQPKKKQLHSVNLIRHAKLNSLHQISGVQAVSRIMAFCIQHSYNAEYLEHHLDFISGLCNHIKVYEVGFLPDDSITDFIKSHED
jgi:hypothetical protein